MYEIQFTRAAHRSFSSLPKKDQRKVDEAILSLSDEPQPAGCRKIKGSGDLLRIRVGLYRVVYRVEGDALVILVVRVGHRKDVYRRL